MKIPFRGCPARIGAKESTVSRRFFCDFRPLIILLSTAHILSADPLPAKDSGATFGSHHGLGFSDGTLYLHTGDTIYSVDATHPADPSFTLHMNGLRSAFAGPPRVFESGFATADGGHALVSMGFTDGGVLAIDLVGKTTQFVSDFDIDNIFNAAGRVDGTFYAMRVDPGFATSTFVYHVDPSTHATDAVVDPAAGTGDASGGMTFDASGNLLVSSFDFTNGRANFYSVLASDLLGFESQGTTPPVTLLGGGPANGNYNIVVTSNDTIFFNTTTGIGQLNPATGTVSNIYRDILDPDLFNYDPFKQPLNGLAYDVAMDHIVFAEFNDTLDAYELVWLAMPEPTGLMSFGLALVISLSRRRNLRTFGLGSRH